MCNVRRELNQVWMHVWNNLKTLRVFERKLNLEFIVEFSKMKLNSSQVTGSNLHCHSVRGLFLRGTFCTLWALHSSLACLFSSCNRSHPCFCCVRLCYSAVPITDFSEWDMGSDKTLPGGNSLGTSLISAVHCWSILCHYCQQFLQPLSRLTCLKFFLSISLVSYGWLYLWVFFLF